MLQDCHRQHMFVFGMLLRKTRSDVECSHITNLILFELAYSNIITFIIMILGTWKKNQPATSTMQTTRSSSEPR